MPKALSIAGSDGTLTAIGLGAPDISAPAAVTFDNTDPGRTLTRTITLSNMGDEPLQVQNIASSSGVFGVQGPAPPLTVETHQSVRIDVTFTPAARGITTGSLIITSSDPDEPQTSVALTGSSYAVHTITASAVTGGRISPSGDTSVPVGGSQTYTITPDPGYELTSLLVDGTSALNPTPNQTTYTIKNVESNHTITAVFSSYFNYFGLQDGNGFQSLARVRKGGFQVYTDDISLDTTTFPDPSYLDRKAGGGIEADGWYQVFSNGLFIKQLEQSGETLTFDTPLPMILTPLHAGAHWKASSPVTIYGIPAVATIKAKVKRQKLVSVPAGRFLAWPISYRLSIRARGRKSVSAFTNWFAPYVSVSAMTKTGPVTDQMTSFAVGAGKVTTPPPVVAGTVPRSTTRGSAITVNGFQFGSSQGAGKVMIGNLECGQILSWTDTQIQCVVPDDAVSGPVTVVTDPWTSNNSVTLTVVVPPQITAVSPSEGTRGASLQIQGEDFGTVPGKVKHGTVRAHVTQWTDTSITCAVPAKTPYGVCSVTVVDSMGKSVLPDAFTVEK